MKFPAWEKEKWRGRLNADLWKRFLAIHRTFTNTVEFIWVKGHNGDVENENCDKLANGVYIYKCKIQSPGHKMVEKTEKLVILN
mgnify:CR=1 FL=1